MKTTTKLAWLVLVALLALGIGCGKKEDESATGGAATSSDAAYKPTGDEGTVSGVVNFTGTAPSPRKISMDADPYCNQQHPGGATADNIVVSDGKLANVFVYVKDGLGNKTFDVPSKASELDQKGCMYQPHVVGVMARQKLSVTTSDNTSHNVNVIPKSNQGFNESQGPGAPALEKTFARPETSIPVKCNQHPWMRAVINVVSHPFYAVTGPDGSYELKGLPPGDYTIAAWHEEFGEKTQKVTVGAKESKTAEFGYDGTKASMPAPSGFAVAEPLILPLFHKH